jgi:hypothetical protein
MLTLKAFVWRSPTMHHDILPFPSSNFPGTIIIHYLFQPGQVFCHPLAETISEQPSSKAAFYSSF